MNRIVWIGRAVLLSVAVVIGAPALAADPTLNQVYEAVRAGRLNQAQAMMADVLRDHPNSAKAHYVEAEILARQGHPGEAQGELSRAEQLAPGLPFVSQASVQELRGVIAAAGARRTPTVPGIQPAGAPAGQPTVPWGLLLIVLAAGVVVYAIIRARRNAVAALPYSGGGAAVPAYGTPPMAPMGGGIGSGIVGGLVTGAALGAGMVAGEALAHDLIDGHASSRDPRRVDTTPAGADDLGGQDFGIGDPGSWDDGGGLGGGGSWD